MTAAQKLLKDVIASAATPALVALIKEVGGDYLPRPVDRMARAYMLDEYQSREGLAAVLALSEEIGL